MKPIGFKLKTAAIVFCLCALAQAKTKKVEELVLEPMIQQTTADQEQEFNVKGGTPPYVFKTSAGMIRYKDNTAIYVAPSFAGPATVSVQDAKGFTKSILITVLPDRTAALPAE